MDSKLSILISSCDKFSDLWEENIKAYKKYWVNNPHKTYLVTDKHSTWDDEDVNLIVANGQNDFPLRIKYALNSIKSKYILVTLDDYFLINSVSNEKIDYLLKRMESENIQYLSLYNRRVTKEKKYKKLEELTPIDLSWKYAITLYPAIWETEFLRNAIKEDMSPWMFEPSLTKTAIALGANCQASLSGVYDILDVVRKGKVLHKADRYFRKNNIDIGRRQRISYFTEMKLFIMDLISWYMPKNISKRLKKLLKKLGFTFYSED